MASRTSWRVTLLGAATAMLLATAGCAPLGVIGQLGGSSSTPNPSGAPTGFESYYAQSIRWNFCGVDMQCGHVMAPTDWSDPASDPITISLNRHLASTSPAIGDLVVNPGGPGESAIDFVRDYLDRAVDAPLRDAFNIVGIDPRGVGRSTPVTCYTNPSQMDDALYGIPPGTRDSPEWNDAVDAATAEFGAACAKNTGALLQFVDTPSAARDMDMVRAALGNEKLDFLGYSYGTYLGAVYAEIFPHRVGRMVLDGAVDPTVPPEVSTYGQAVAFEKALDAYLAWCVDGGDCPLGQSQDESAAALSRLLLDVDASPIENADGRLLGADTLVTAILWPLYDDTAWPFLTDVISATLLGDASIAFSAADGYNGRNSDGSYASNATEAFIAINCLDTVETDVTRVGELNALLERDAPILGPYLGPSETGCAGWPAAPKGSLDPINALGAPDLLVIGTTNDPATPYENAVSLADQMSSAHLVTFEGEGHTAYNRGNACVNQIVNDYFLRGKIPTARVTCA